MEADQLFTEEHPTFKALGCLTRAFCAQHPETGVLEFALATDDGQGNGEFLFTLPLVTLERVVSDYKRRTDEGDVQFFEAKDVAANDRRHDYNVAPFLCHITSRTDANKIATVDVAQELLREVKTGLDQGALSLDQILDLRTRIEAFFADQVAR